ncbi:hypothetical protein JHK82_015548 [Glycine max]|nr:hypothetical protein JHK82_015548 [Glycine max]
MGKKTKKPGKGKEKTERKTARAEEKKARRETKKLSPEDDIDAILLSIQKEEAKKKDVQVDDNVPAPSPRSNCSLTVNPLKETELILYGGEFYNGNKVTSLNFQLKRDCVYLLVECCDVSELLLPQCEFVQTFVYGDLFRYDVEKLEWKLVSSPNSPPPRSAHQAVAWKNYVYIFGGEFTSPNQERFHHYKDFWMLDLKTNQWEQLNLKGCPSPRSGHRMVLYKHKIILFGGFYDTLREVRYYNDLFVFDLDQFKWQEIKPKPAAMWPTARSGFQLFVYQDDASESEWVEASDDDEENEDDDEDESDSDGSTDEDEDDEEEEEEEAQNASVQVVDAVALIKGVGKNLRRKERRSRIEQIRASLGLSDSQRTPLTQLPSSPCAVVYPVGKAQSDWAKLPTFENSARSDTGKDREQPPVLLPTADLEARIGEEFQNEGRNRKDLGGQNMVSEMEGEAGIMEEEVDVELLAGPLCFDREGTSGPHKLSILPRGCQIRDSKTNREVGNKDKEAPATIAHVTQNNFPPASDTQHAQLGPLIGKAHQHSNNNPQHLSNSPTKQFLECGKEWKELRKDGFDLAEARYRELKPILDELALLEAEQKAEEAEAPETSAKKRGKKKTRN